jgi:hypothetical protein
MDGRCALRLTRRYKAPRGAVWQALTERESLERWLGAGDVHPRTVEPGRVLEFELGDSVARIELTTEGDTTILVLDHERIPAAVGMTFIRRWTNALERFDRTMGR